MKSSRDGCWKNVPRPKPPNEKLQPFDVELLRTLFLIRYVDVMPGNVDNLVSLCIDEVDVDRLELRRGIEEGLTRLEAQVLISRSGDIYYFLTNEERDVSREIRQVDLDPSELTKLMAGLIYDEVFQGVSEHRYAVNRTDYPFSTFCDGYLHGPKGERELVLSIITPLADDYAFYIPGRCITASTEFDGQVLIRLPESKDLEREIYAYLKTDKYVRMKSDPSNPQTLQRILRERSEENRERRGRLRTIVQGMVESGDYYVAGQRLEVTAKNAAAARVQAFDYLLKNTFNKVGYLGYVHDEPQKELLATLTATDLTLDLKSADRNARALEELREYVELMARGHKRMVLEDVLTRFYHRPWGWPEWQTLILFAQLVRKQEVNLVMGDVTLTAASAGPVLTKTAQWKNVVLLKRKVTPRETLQQARRLGKELFEKMGPDAEDELFVFLQKHLRRWDKELSGYRPLTNTGRYPGGDAVEAGLKRIGPLTKNSDSADFLDAFLEAGDDLLDQAEVRQDLKDFYQSQRPIWERCLDTLEKDLAPNEYQLKKVAEAREAWAAIRTILEAPEPYQLLKQAEKHLETLAGVNTRLVNRRREKAHRGIDLEIGRVKKALEKAGANSDLSNRCLLPLQQLKKRVDTTETIPVLDALENDAQEAAINALESLETATTMFEGGDDKQPPPAKVKKRVVLVDARLQVTGAYLETEEDLKAFITRLSREIRNAIQDGHRVRIK